MAQAQGRELVRALWSDQERDDAMRLGEDEFLAAYPHRSRKALRIVVDEQLGGQMTYAQYRLSQHQQSPRDNQLRQAERNLRPIAALIEAEPDEDHDDTPPLPEEPAALERLFSAYKEVQRATTALGKPSKTMRWRWPVDGPIGIAQLGDVLAGNLGCDLDRFEDDVRTIAETDGLYRILMGDLIDNYKPQAKSGTGLYGALFGNPDLQVAYIATRLRWARGKWLALLEGNHEGFDGRWAGIDRLPDLADDLGIPYFTETGGSVFVEHGEATTHIVAKHNHRGNSQINKGNSPRRLWDEWPWAFESAHVIMLAHTHEPHMEQVMRRGEVVIYSRSGTYKTSDEWAENLGWRPSYGVPVVIIWPDGRRLAFHGANFREAVRFLADARKLWAEEREAEDDLAEAA
jgi:hypothetical protein